MRNARNAGPIALTSIASRICRILDCELVGNTVIATYLAEDRQAILFDIGGDATILAGIDDECYSDAWIETVESPVVPQFECNKWCPPQCSSLKLGMAKRATRPRDINQLAKLVVGIATGEVEEKRETKRATAGRRGGLKGGVTRMAMLTEAERQELAKKAANKRWGKGRAQTKRAT